MDLVKAFTENNQTVNINIQGTHEDPLFQANQIGELLGIKNIRDTLQGFDGDEVHVGTTDTNAGTRRALFLTEVGLYRLLGMSRKPLARPFQRWVARTIKEIRLTGKYDLERSVEDERRKSQQALEEAQMASQEALELERQARRSAEETARLLQVKLASRHIPGQQLYVLQNPADNERKLYKLGKTKDLSKRVASYGTAIPDGVTILHTVNCIDSLTCEKVAGRALEPYRYNGEWFQCDLSIITNILDAAVVSVDGITRCGEHLEKYETVARIRSIFDEIESSEDIRSSSQSLAGKGCTRRIKNLKDENEPFPQWFDNTLRPAATSKVHIHRIMEIFNEAHDAEYRYTAQGTKAKLVMMGKLVLDKPDRVADCIRNSKPCNNNYKVLMGYAFKD